MSARRGLIVAGRAGLALAAMCVGLSGHGCASDPAQGYTLRSAMPANVRTVAVPVFDNQTFYQGLELELTDALVKELQRRTGLAVVQGGAAETTLTGVIRDVDLRNLTTSGATGLSQEMALDMTVDFEWRDARSGKPLASVQSLKAIESFVASRRTGERIELGRQAVAQEMARRIVAQMQSDW